MNEAQTHLLRSIQNTHLVSADAIITATKLSIENSTYDRDAESYVDDMVKIHTAATDLYQFTKEQVQPEGKPFYDDRSASDQLSTLRHDLKNRLNHIMGPCQFLLLDEPEGQLKHDVDLIKGLVDDCLAALDNENVGATPPTELPEFSDGAEVEARKASPLTIPKFSAPSFDTALRQKVEPGNILVADDDETNRQILHRFLKSQGHEVSFAKDGREALAIMDEKTFDLVLLDIIMPEIDGFKVLETMHGTGELRHTPVIVLTGLNDVPAAVHCIGMGAEDFLSRPFQLQLLKARVDACLEKKRLRERLYEQFFTPELAREITRQPDLLKIDGRKANVSILFCDIRGFSTISERIGPSDTMSWLRDVMGTLSDCVMQHGGVLVDYTGDELMAMWGAPETKHDHATRACQAARDMLAELPNLDARWKDSIESNTTVGIGINSGDVFVGNVGTSRKFKYGPLGTAVNVASRVQGATKYLRTSVLITKQTLDQLDEGLAARQICKVKVTNIEEPIELFELAPADDPTWEELRTDYEQALQAFSQKDFRTAASILGNILVHHPNDGPTLVLMSRAVDSMLSNGESFDETWTLPGK